MSKVVYSPVCLTSNNLIKKENDALRANRESGALATVRKAN